MTESERRPDNSRSFTTLSTNRTAKNLETSKIQLDDSSTKNPKLFVGFMGVLLYTLVMTLAVTDENLLMGTIALVPKLQLGNSVREAPASRQLTSSVSPQSNPPDLHSYAHWNTANVQASQHSLA